MFTFYAYSAEEIVYDTKQYYVNKNIIQII